MEYCLTMKKDIGTLSDLDGLQKHYIMLSEKKSQFQKVIFSVIPFLWHPGKGYGDSL